MKLIVLIAISILWLNLTLLAQRNNSNHSQFNSYLSGSDNEISLKSVLDKEYLADSVFSFNWDESINDWQFQQKFTYSYNAGGKPTDYFIYLYMAPAKTWILFFRENYTYNAKGNVLEKITYSLNEASSLVYSQKEVNIYHSGDEMIDSTIQYYWDEPTDGWVNSSKTVYSYNEKGDETEIVYSSWDPVLKKWYYSSKKIYTYNSNGGTETNITNVWDVATNKWVGKYKWVYTYDDSGKEIESVRSDWDLVANDWTIYSKYLTTFSDGEKVTERIYLLWNSVSKNWDKVSRTVTTFDTGGKFTESVSYRWDISSNNWLYVTKEIETFDSNSNWIGMVMTDWDILTSAWINTYKTSLYYSLHDVGTTGSSPVSEANLLLYPNPVLNGELKISLPAEYKNSSVAIFNMDGKRVYHSILMNSNSILNLNSVSPGIYILQISNGLKTEKRKFVKE
jgi:hypothetical protein